MTNVSTRGDPSSDNKDSRADVLTVAQAIAQMRGASAADVKKQPAKRPLHTVDSVPGTTPLIHKLKEPPHKKQAIESGAPQDNSKQQSTSFDSSIFTSPTHDQTATPVTLKDTDVLSGRGGSVNSHPGNQRYWTILSRFRKQYQGISSRDFDRKQHIADHVYKLVREGGVRFMKRDRKNGLVEEQTEEESLEKIKQGLRSSYTPTFLAEVKTNLGPIQTREKETGGGNTVLAPPMEMETGSGKTAPVPPMEKTPAPPTPERSDSDFDTDAEFDAESKIKLRDEDVLVGPGDGFNNHPGNVDYLAEVSKQQPEFRALKMKERKKRKSIAMGIFTWVFNRNGRFLRRQADGEYQELSATEALVKITDALRDERYRVGEQDDVEIGTMGPMSKDKSDPGQAILHQDSTSGIVSTSVFPKGSSTIDDQVSKQNIAVADEDRSEKTIQLRDIDVLAGQGTGVAGHPGNLRFWKILKLFQREYQSIYPQNSTKMQSIAHQVHMLVRQGGTRYIKRNKENGLLEELSEAALLEKINRGLRGAKFLTETESDPKPLEESAVNIMHEATGKMATDQALPPSQQVARQPTHLTAVSEHTTMSESFNEDDDTTGSFANVQEGPEETSEIVRDVTDATVNELTHVTGLNNSETGDEQSTRPKQVQYQSPVDAETGVGRHLEPQSQQVYVSIHEDDEEVGLWEIPQDVPGRPGKEWKTSSVITGRMGSRVDHASTFATYHKPNDDAPVASSHQLPVPFNRSSGGLAQQAFASFRGGDVLPGEDNGAYSIRNTVQPTGYFPSNEHMPPAQVAPVPMFVPPRESTSREPQQLELQEPDVLSGQGSGSANRPGNQRYLQKVRELQQEYWSLEERDLIGKTALAKEVYNFVKDSGGRFVHKRFPLDLYVEEISEDKALKKIRRALRDGKPTGGKK